MFRLLSRPLFATLLALVLLMAWDASGGDLWLARMAGMPYGFPLRTDWWLVTVLHQGGKALSWVLVAALLLAVYRPVGLLSQLERAQRWQLVLSVLAGVAAVVLLKQVSRSSCPWDLAEFGGMARYVSHWTWGVDDGGPGHCFPAGHASAAFAFVGGWFALRRRAPRAAALCLVLALAAGLLLGVGQQLRGAHYLSHTLWTAWICWVAGWGVDAGCRFIVRRRRGTWTSLGMEPGTKLNIS